MSQDISKTRISEGRMVAIALIGGFAAFVVLLVFISGGSVRHVEITFPEKTEVTLAFTSMDGEVKVVGIKGIAQVNPTILMRTGDFAMELTVVNHDIVPHALYIEGVNVSTKVLGPGESDTVTFYSEGEGTYNYYVVGDDKPLGEVRAVKVTMYE